MRKHGLLKREAGSAVVESIFAIVFLMVLALGTIQVALALYARNIVVSAAHEAARAGVERGASLSDAEHVARFMVQTAGGRLVDGLSVSTDATDAPGVRIVDVRISGTIDILGPFPIPVPVEARARATADRLVE